MARMHIHSIVHSVPAGFNHKKHENAEPQSSFVNMVTLGYSPAQEDSARNAKVGSDQCITSSSSSILTYIVNISSHSV